LLYFYGRNVRLRPVEEYVLVERRTTGEYIDALAQLYERARAAPLVVEAAARRLRQLARSAPGARPEVETLLQRAQAYSAQEERPAQPAAALRLVQELIHLRKQFYGSRTLS
jgi:hypothetical protein